jgi:FKBP12-rapamycin complex-associated protein
MCRRSRQITILPLVEAISLALGGEFKVYLSQLIPQILRIFHYDDSDKRTSTVCD